MLLEVSATKWDIFSTYLSRANPERYYPSPEKTQITKCTSQALTSQTWTSRRQWASCAHPPPVLHAHQYRHRRVWATPQAGQAPASCGGDGDGDDDGGASLGAAGPAERTIHGAPWRGRSVSRSSFVSRWFQGVKKRPGASASASSTASASALASEDEETHAPTTFMTCTKRWLHFSLVRPDLTDSVKVRSMFNVQCSKFRVQSYCLSAAFLFVVSFSVFVEARRKRSGYR